MFVSDVAVQFCSKGSRRQYFCLSLVRYTASVEIKTRDVVRSLGGKPQDQLMIKNNTILYKYMYYDGSDFISTTVQYMSRYLLRAEWPKVPYLYGRGALIKKGPNLISDREKMYWYDPPYCCT